MSYETDLRSILQSKDKNLFERLSIIDDIALHLLNYTQGSFPFYTPHGISHSRAVEDHLNWLIPEKIKREMNSHEIFFLITAAIMHDWGMIGKSGENPEKIRETHHIRTEKYFEDLYSDLKLDEHEARIIGRICKGHRKENLYDELFDDVVFGHNIRIRRRFLAAALRIADECDITYGRTPEIIYHSINPAGKSEEEFKKHLCIGGVGQLDEKYKIYISGVARDPKGAKTLRLLRDKMQAELDSVKGILATNGINLDIIELRIETKGFVDKPISFELNKRKIFELLIGQNLYKNKDVAIRELLQNSIDACKLERSIKPKQPFKILFKKTTDTLEIEDNGSGMDYNTAKNFLSVVGSSYYSSEEFKQLIEGKAFVPISRFGIGILSCFLIADGMTIETKKDGFRSCKFTINSIDEDWKYENGTMEHYGTKIELKLNNFGKQIELEKTVKRYFVSSDVDIFIEDKGLTSKFDNSWALEKLENRFEGLKTPSSTIHGQQIDCFSTDNFDLIIGRYNDSCESSTILLFNQGVFVSDIDFSFVNSNIIVIINAKRDLFDLVVSRENVVENRKWSDFISTVFSEIFSRVWMKNKDNYDNYFAELSTLIEPRCTFGDYESLEKLFASAPVLNGFINSVVIPMINNRVRYLKFNEINTKRITIYHISSNKPSIEMNLIRKFFDPSTLYFINPFGSIGVKFQDKYNGLLISILKTKGIILETIDFSELILKNVKLLEDLQTDMMPSNVEIGYFPEGWKPVVIVKEKAKMVDEKEISLGSAYWGNIALWQKLTGQEVCSEIFHGLGIRGQFLKSVKVISEHKVIVDAEDDFVKKILTARAKKPFDESVAAKVKRYFAYLAYLPLVLGEIHSSIIFLDILDNMEKELAKNLAFDCSEVLLKRMKPTASFYIDQTEGEYSFFVQLVN